MLKLDPDLFPHRWASSDSSSFILPRLSVYKLLLKIFEILIKKILQIWVKIWFSNWSQIQFQQQISTAGCQSWLTAYLDCFNSDNNPKKNIDKTILLRHKSSEQQLSETLSPTIDDCWLVLTVALAPGVIPVLISVSWSHKSGIATKPGSHWSILRHPGLSLVVEWVTTQEKLTTTIIFPPRTKLLCFYFKHISRGGGF